MKRTKMITIFTIAAILCFTLSGCGNGGTQGFDQSQKIHVVSREDGSGTRGAFIELFGIEEKDASGNKVDHTTVDAAITNSTSVMLTTVSDDPYAIGYVSLGALNDTVKALSIDGAAASQENIRNGSYTISRPFNIATTGTVAPLAADFISYILSEQGQTIVAENGYIAVETNGTYQAANLEGKIVVAGSSSVTPVMEKLKEAYLVLNPNSAIELQQSDSTTGMNSLIDGICDIGMASRELKDSELSQGLQSTVIALDGIAVIINNASPLSDLSKDAVKDIYLGNTTDWLTVIGE